MDLKRILSPPPPIKRLFQDSSETLQAKVTYQVTNARFRILFFFLPESWRNTEFCRRKQKCCTGRNSIPLYLCRLIAREIRHGSLITNLLSNPGLSWGRIKLLLEPARFTSVSISGECFGHFRTSITFFFSFVAFFLFRFSFASSFWYASRFSPLWDCLRFLYGFFWGIVLRIFQFLVDSVRFLGIFMGYFEVSLIFFWSLWTVSSSSWDSFSSHKLFLSFSNSLICYYWYKVF